MLKVSLNSDPTLLVSCIHRLIIMTEIRQRVNDLNWLTVSKGLVHSWMVMCACLEDRSGKKNTAKESSLLPGGQKAEKGELFTVFAFSFSFCLFHCCHCPLLWCHLHSMMAWFLSGNTHIVTCGGVFLPDGCFCIWSVNTTKLSQCWI